jgi:hypothetical protein
VVDANYREVLSGEKTRNDGRQRTDNSSSKGQNVRTLKRPSCTASSRGLVDCEHKSLGLLSRRLAQTNGIVNVTGPAMRQCVSRLLSTCQRPVCQVWAKDQEREEYSGSILKNVHWICMLVRNGS